jgi:hypothetical protein
MNRCPIEQGEMVIAEALARQRGQERDFAIGRAAIASNMEHKQPVEVDVYKRYSAKAAALYSDILLHGYYLDYR